MEDKSTTWVIAQTKPNGHRMAEEHLHRQGFVTYLPMIEETRRRSGRFVHLTAPVFPGYIFVAKDPDAMRWRAINSTRGITKLVSTGSAPAEVPAGLIAALRERFDQGGDTPSDLAEGDTVRVGGGPFTDFLGRIEKIDPKDRIWVLLDVLGRPTRVSLDKRDVRKT